MAPTEAAPLDETLIASLVEDAILAPSMHNAQPWIFHYDPGTRTFRIRADRARELPLADPDRRALHISCAAAVLNLRVAAVRAGWDPVVGLLPDPADPDLLAEIELLPRRSESYEELAELYPALHRRHTSRAPFGDERVEGSLLDVLSRAALLEGAHLAFPDTFHRRTILDLSSEALVREQEDAAHRAEIARWTGDPPAGGIRDDGIPRYAFGPRSRGGGVPVRDFGPAPGASGTASGGPGATATPRSAPPLPDPDFVRESAVFEESPQLALLGTARDQPADWLRAGQAMERVLLEATLDGLATSVASQALEWSDLRWAIRDPASAMGHVHMVIRLGYGPTGPVTRRRTVGEVLSIGGAQGARPGPGSVT
ncbi:nitroreductase [Streptomyces qinzhouensis]|uniref:Nitroreductase n=1 Tax=Streptomyces qinzhouensis TaxID=2599401 RepID=A0A5B8JSR8_9ACTN|nr:nitroreductase [Streptomyces qinzhouensis]QDY81150.1 nitroreductase [Streptomyces qinzhouensis]